jgi:geranylgeranyl pyrophosphate synthase
MIKIVLVEHLSEVTEVTTAWIRDKVLRDDYRGLTPMIEHSLTSTVPDSDRAIMVKLGCELQGEDWHEALPAMAAWELLNINLLVTDDFFDRRTTRRMGQKTILQKWGEEACLVLGFVLTSIASEALISAWNKSSRWSLHDALEVLTWATKWEYYSQFQESELMTTAISETTLEMYVELIKASTAVGIAGSFELGCVMGRGNSKKRAQFRDFAMDLGCLLQIRDDLIDYIYNESLIKKGPFNDLFTKKRRLPILAAYWEGSQTEKRRIEKLLKKKVLNLEDALTITEMITSPKVERRIRGISYVFEESARKKLSGLPEIRPARVILSDLIDLFTEL